MKSQFFQFLKQLYRWIRNTHRIAVIVPADTGRVVQILEGFLLFLKKHGGRKFEPCVYSMAGDRAYLHSFILPALQREKYDLLFIMGTECMQGVVEMFKDQPTLQRVPIICAGVRDFDAVGLDDSMKKYVTGIRANSRPDLFVDYLMRVKPYTKKVGILYNPYECGGATGRIKQEIEYRLAQYGIIVVFVKLSRPEQVYAGALGLISHEVDTIMIPPDNMVLRATKVVAEACMVHNVTLYASELTAISAGAGLAFGCMGKPTGEECAKTAMAILRDKVPVDQIPITDMSEPFYLTVNSHVYQKQGLEPKFTKEFFAKQGLDI